MKYLFKEQVPGKPTPAELFILVVIIINAVVLFLQECGYDGPLIRGIDIACIIIFIIEMIIKIIEDRGFRNYWNETGWNKMDFLLVVASVPALLSYLPFIDASLMHSVILLRILRVFRFLKLLKMFGSLGKILQHLGKAIVDSMPIFIGYLLLIFVFALISCDMFRDISPEYFGSPLEAIYSTFRICTTEGWYDIPDALSIGLSAGQIAWVRIYFIFIVVSGGIIGLSLVNSIFVDAMVSDNNNKLETEVANLNRKIDDLTKKLDELKK